MKLGRAKDIAGQRFGKLLVLSLVEKSKNGTTKWRCKCECGIEKVLFSTVLNRGQKSCGCDARAAASVARTTHGLTGSPTYNSWRSMHSRCLNNNNPDYAEYGGRGVGICEKWKEFESFLADMGTRPQGMSLDRKDNDGNYEPSNCKWSTAKEQANNRRPARPGRWVTKESGVSTVSGALT